MQCTGSVIMGQTFVARLLFMMMPCPSEDSSMMRMDEGLVIKQVPLLQWTSLTKLARSRQCLHSLLHTHARCKVTLPALLILMILVLL